MKNKKRIGVALGSGGARGIVHIAIFEMLDNLRITPYCIAGSSIGSVVGAIYSYGTLNEFKKEILALNRKDIIKMIDPHFSKSGLIKGDKLLKFIKRFIPEDLNIEDLPIKTAIVATDYGNGKQVVFRKGNVLNAIRASISIPGIFYPIKLKNRILMDGGIINPLPIDIVKKMGSEKVIAVNLNPGTNKKIKEIKKPEASKLKVVTDRFNNILPENFRKNPNSSSILKWFENRKKEKVPSIYESIVQTIGIFEHQNSLLMIKEHPPDVLIEAKVFDIIQLDFTKSKKIYEHGRNLCRNHKKNIIKLMK